MPDAVGVNVGIECEPGLFLEYVAELREWIEEHPDDPLVDEVRERHNECVEVVRQTDRHFYDWSDREIRELERV